MPITDSYTLLGAWPQAEVDLSVETLAAGMNARGVTRSLVTHTSAIFYDASQGNREAETLCSQHAPLDPVAVLNPLSYPQCLDELRRCRDNGIQVFRLCPREHRYPFTSGVGPLTELLEHLADARLVLVDLVDMPQPHLDAELVARLQTPTAFSVDASGLGAIIWAGKRSPNVWVETSRLQGGGAIEAAVRHLGSDRVIFGSAAPLRTLGSAVMSVQYAELNEAERNAIFEQNVQRILG